MMNGLLRILVLSTVLAFISTTSHAKKMEYTLRVYKVIYNGDTLDLGGDVVRSGVIKKHTRRLPIATLDDGRSLHLEMWLTMEGVMLDRFTVFQHRYYTRNGEDWSLLAVSPRLKFIGRHYDRGHYKYVDHKTGESMEVFYELTVDQYKKKKA